jgi:hypothetical protein
LQNPINGRRELCGICAKEKLKNPSRQGIEISEARQLLRVLKQFESRQNRRAVRTGTT